MSSRSFSTAGKQADSRVSGRPQFLSLFVCFHLGWEGDCVGFLHYQQGKRNFSKIQISVHRANDGGIRWRAEGLTGVTGGSEMMG